MEEERSMILLDFAHGGGRGGRIFELILNKLQVNRRGDPTFGRV
jgi:hypothetical protein